MVVRQLGTSLSIVAYLLASGPFQGGLGDSNVEFPPDVTNPPPGSRPSSEAVLDNRFGNAGGRRTKDQDMGPMISGVPRFTWDGCLCQERWRLVGYRSKPVRNYCGNPDQDPFGDWCFVTDVACQLQMTWGYCAPEPRCSQGTEVVMPGLMTPAVIKSNHGTQVVLDWGYSNTTIVEFADLKNMRGESCLHRPVEHERKEQGRGTDGQQFAHGSTEALMEDHEEEIVSFRESLPGHRTVEPSLYEVWQHGSALADQVISCFEDVLARRWTFQHDFERVMYSLQEPRAWLGLEVTIASFLATVGVLPWVYEDDFSQAVGTCGREFTFLDSGWLLAMLHPLTILQEILFGSDELSYTDFLLRGKRCVQNGFRCPDYRYSTMAPFRRCSGRNCHNLGNIPKREGSMWWITTFIAFATIAPTSFCLTMLVLRFFSEFFRSLRRRWTMVEPGKLLKRLRRVQVDADDLRLDPNWLCSICLSGHREGLELLELQCEHVLHYDCVLEWFEQRHSCPMCRCQVSFANCVCFSTSFVDSKQKQVRGAKLQDCDGDDESTRDRRSNVPSLGVPEIDDPALPNAVPQNEGRHLYFL